MYRKMSPVNSSSLLLDKKFRTNLRTNVCLVSLFTILLINLTKEDEIEVLIRRTNSSDTFKTPT